MNEALNHTIHGSIGYEEPNRGLPGDPRWSQTCPNGHYHRVRAAQRPRACPVCGATYPPPDPGERGGHARRARSREAALPTTATDRW